VSTIFGENTLSQAARYFFLLIDQAKVFAAIVKECATD